MLRLSRLARPPVSLNVRHTAPGHANPYFLDRANLIDPSHPAANVPLRTLPSFVCPQFTIRALPNAILQEPADFVPVNPLLATGLARALTKTRAKGRQKWWAKLDINDVQQSINGHPTTCHEKDRRWGNWDAMARHVKFIAARQLADARVAALAKRGRRNVSLLFHTSKKATSKSCVIRRRLRTKMTAAIGLVVCRGAEALGSDKSAIPRQPPLTLVSGSLLESDALVLQDWTYLVIPNLAIYKTPLPNLIQAVRKALLSLNYQSKRLESSWSSGPKQREPSPQKPSIDRQPPSRHSPLQRFPNAVSKSQSVTRTDRPHGSYPTPPTSKRPQCSSPSYESAIRESISSRLYSSQPVILSHKKS